MKKSKISIRWQLFGYLTLLLGVLLVVLWLFQVVFMETFYKSIKKNEIIDVGHTIEKNINSSNLYQIMDNLADSRNLCIVFTDASGQPFYSKNTIGPRASMNNLTNKGYWLFGLAAKENGGELFIYDNQPKTYATTSEQRNDFASRHMVKLKEAQDETAVYAKIIVHEGKEYILLINSFISPVNATVSTIRKQLVYVTVIMIILAFILSIFIARKIADPIIKINTSSKALAERNDTIIFEEKGYKEIAELSRTLSYVSTELTKTESFRRELIANVSHDLRTPLTLISGYAEMMRDLPGENNPENTQIIIDEAKRLTALVNDMLDLSKLQAGTQKLDKHTYNFTQNVKETMERYAALTEKEGYHITFEYDEEVEIEADELKMSQVVYNLINNAINYTGKDKTVAVCQKIVDNKVRIEVVDTGEGIAKENIPYIWDRYYKVDKLHKRAMIGTGLGLSIVRNILDAHQATYGVNSEPHKGSVFWFEITRKL
ncbi:MAG: histidine kinase dimerization/phospho-acceptor domain-containing protein [Cellulosilyticum sp.]|nr:two-component sensor histidine kinase [Cellulosilyticum sp.]MEE1070861.1 histidine kinase dimerization/phospho-acceptor domain-containing protein [Cellulosilyticum sp.]